MEPGANRLMPAGVGGPTVGVAPIVISGSDPNCGSDPVVFGTAEFYRRRSAMKSRLIPTTAIALALTAGLFAQAGRRPASPAGTASTQVLGKYDTSGAEPVYKDGKWIDITYGRPIRRGRDVFGGTGANYGKV